MTVDVSAIASVLGITTNFQDLRDGQAAFLPQKIYILGQGNTSAVYPSDKAAALSAGLVGKTYGYGSPLNLAMGMLRPPNGDGSGSVPIDVLPLSDAPGSVAATGDLTISGTATRAEEYQTKIGGIRSKKFAIPAGAVDVTSATRSAYEAITAVKEMPVDAAYTYGATSSSPGGSNVGNGTMGTVTVNGTPRPGDWKLTITAAALDGGTFKLTDPTGNDSLTTGTVGVLYDANGFTFTLADGATDFAVGDTFTITIPATDIQFTSKAKGAWTNEIKIVPITPKLDAGVVFAVTEMSGGLINPEVSDALALIGNEWGTVIINCLNIGDSSALDAIQNFGEGRWGTLVHKPIVSVLGVVKPTYAESVVVSDARPTDRVNSQVPFPGSDELPLRVAARAVARMALQANNDPAVDYVGLKLDLLEPGADVDQWDDATRNAAINAGSSTIEVRNGIAYMGDFCTFYHPDEEDPAAYQFVVNINRTQNVIYNLWLEFVKQSWAGAPLIGDSDSTTNRNAKKPKMAVAAVAKIVDGLADAAILANREFAKKSIKATIGGPRRLDVELTTPYSGNTNIKNVVHNWGFYFGG